MRRLLELLAADAEVDGKPRTGQTLALMFSPARPLVGTIVPVMRPPLLLPMAV
jgi:hypothetical protein